MSRIFLFCILFQANCVLAQNDTLMVAAYHSPPFSMQNNSGQLSGLMVEIWEDIAKELKIPYKYVITDIHELMIGLESGVYDVGLGAITVTPKREKTIDFTHAINPSGTGIAVYKQSLTTSFFQKWAPILIDLFELIIGLLIMLFLSAFIVFFIEKKYTNGEKSERNIESVADGLWWAAVTMTTVGYGDKVPKSRVGKLLGIVWIFISIIFFSLFTANTSAKLSNYGVSSNVRTLDDLRDVTVVAVSKSSGEEFLQREGVHHINKDNIEQAIEAVIQGEADAVVSNVPVLKYHNKSNFRHKLIIAEEFLIRNNMAIGLKTNSKLKEKINMILLQKINESKWQHAVYKYIGD